MKKKKSLKRIVLPFLSVLFLLAAFRAFSSFGSGKKKKLCGVTAPDGERIFLELALTDEERRRGLMGRNSLPWDRGMLFVFEDYGDKYFWMKDTLIPLDIVFLDPEWKVARIFTLPPSGGKTPDFLVARAHSKAKYVLELNAGKAAALSLSEGTEFNMSSCLPD